MANFNKVVLLGRLTNTPELKQTPIGVTVTSFSIAVDRRTTAGKEKETDFFNVVAWRDRAEFICKYFKKGSHIIIDGELQTRSWTDQQGNKRQTTEVIVASAGFVDAKTSEGSPSAVPSTPSAQPSEVHSNTNAASAQKDEDLPF